MKKLIFAVALVAAGSLHAQNTFLNNSLVNSTADLYGTARYVGMGGAMGALGTDISTMAFNPAGIGLARKFDVALTFGAIWNNRASDYHTNAHATFDQAGFIIARPNEGGTSFSFGFNYQKKLNFNHAFDIMGWTNGLSQMGQLADLANGFYDTHEYKDYEFNLAGMAFDDGYTVLATDADGNPVYVQDANGNLVLGSDGKPIQAVEAGYGQEAFRHIEKTWGSVQAFDLDFAFNVNDRAYFGLDLSFDNVDYHAISAYSEFYDASVMSEGDYTLHNDTKITGWGFNMKLGAIVRPFEDNSFRFGAAIETPTWYRLQNSSLALLWDDTPDAKNQEDWAESFLRYRLTTPWRFRLSAGSTIGRHVVWGIDYEIANWGRLRQKIGDDYMRVRDYGMNAHAKQTLDCMHLLRVGVEGWLTNNFALRAGYNFATSPMKNEVGYDQYCIDSRAMDFSTSTNYMRLKPTHTITLGLGYKGKNFYADLAYKIRSQKADFYAFDTSFTSGDMFPVMCPGMAGATIEPVEVDKTTHQIMATLGVKF